MDKKQQQEDTSGQNHHTYPLTSIYFYLTEGCNLACRHCWIAPKYQAEGRTYPSLDMGLFTSIIEQAKPLGLSSVKLTGGEPLLHPKIREIIGHIKRENLRLTMETNGILMNAAMAGLLASCPGIFVSVSIDGSRAETHDHIRGVEGSFDKACEGVRLLVKAGIRPQVIMSVMRSNREEMEGLVALAQSLGAGSVKFNVVQPTARGEKMAQCGDTLTIGELIETGAWVERALSTATPIKLFYHHPAAFRPLGKLFGDTGDGCSVCGILSIIGIIPDGSSAFCGIGESVPELVFGHASRDALMDVWQSTPLLNELREGLPKKFEGICGDCVMKGACLGSCIAQNYYQSKSLWAPHWYCIEALEAGLFPLSRSIRCLTAPSR